MKQEILHIPSFALFDNDWDLLQEFLNRRGNPPYSIGDNLDLFKLPIESLGNLISVGGYLDLQETPIESLGNLTSVGCDLYLGWSKIKSLGNLTSVGGNLFLTRTSIESLGNLTSVGSNLDLGSTPLSEKYSEIEIRDIVKVVREIFI